MKFEIITDSEDMLVLVTNSRVVKVSYDLSSIYETMTELYLISRDKEKLPYNKADIELKAIESKDKSVIEIVTESSVGSLGGMLNF